MGEFQSRLFQWTWALLHLSAAVLAMLAAGAHLGSAVYHVEKARGL